jgi:RNA polymerase sigma-70 factor (ECF subfamily)
MPEKKRIAEIPSLDPLQWVDQYGDLLYKFALSRIKDPATAEDLVQETFLAALRSQKNFQGRSAVKTWLVAILKHKIVDFIRKKVREQPTDMIESLSDAVDGSFKTDGKWELLPSKWSGTPGKIYEQKEFMDVLYRCLAELPDRQAEAFKMREIDELSTDEICKALNISATNSWVMLYRARMWLRHCLEKKWFAAAIPKNS